MKILQNETTNNNTTTSTTVTTNSKEKQQHLQQPTSHSQQQIVEKRKAKTLKNKILQNVAQQQQQEEDFQYHQRQQHQKNAIANNNNNTPSAMTDERTKVNCNNNCNSSKSNNSNTADIKTETTATSSSSGTNLLKDSLKDSSSSSRNNNDSSSNGSELIIAEAAKILLKNGLNGTNAAAAAAVATATATLLTAAANFHQLPTVSSTISPTKCNLTSVSSTSAQPIPDTSTLADNVTTAAAAAHAQLVAIAAAAAAVSATNQKRLSAPPTTTLSTATATSSSSSSPTCKSPNQTVNNGLLDDIRIQTTSATTSIPSTVGNAAGTHFTKPYKTSSCKSTMSSSMDMNIFDYTVNSNSNNNNASAASSSSVINLSASANNDNSNNSYSNIGQPKFLNNSHSHSNRSDIGRSPISQLHHQTSNVNNPKSAASGGYGGRLQFFKDGKFILELARSKDGEKEGWVSVPRKLFRTPSAATSSTVTPSATASTSAASIPSSLTTSPTVVGGTSYPKNECSNSLSFSDDNSSLQSSPWQRDHCWKQAAPRKNVSKELKLFYRRPAYHKFTTEALLLSDRKRRKPYDMKMLENGLIFTLNSKNKIQQQPHRHQLDKFMLIKKEVEEVEESNKRSVENKKHDKSVKSNTEDAKAKVDADKSECTDDKKEHNESSDCNSVIKIKTEIVEPQVADFEMAKTSSQCKANVIMDSKSLNVQREGISEKDQVDKMNTSECTDEEEEEANSTKNLRPSNGVSSEDVLQQKQHLPVTQGDFKKTGDEEKRLKKHENYKTRAKLTTIVQKLIDVSTSRLVAKTSNTATSAIAASFTSSSSSTSTNTLTSGGPKNQNSKVSPPSNTTASRLVEYHQQHVSPRKRILREFEKVSLEDNSSGVSGGKRSRSKGINTTTLSTNSNAASSPSATIATNKSMSLNTHYSNIGNTSKSVSTAAPTKLYSSYSIHSLLGGGVSTSTTPSPAVKKSTDLPATITSNSMAFSAYHSASFPSNSLRNNSPKSPEANNVGGGKSPSNSVSKSKRSPPYSSPLRETPSRSPITCGSGGYTDHGGRRSPKSTPDTVHNKLRYTSSGGTDSVASPTNHQLQQHHLQQHYQHQPQTYYSPYMMSPHYVPPLSASNALSPNATSTNVSTSSSRSPRHQPSAFRATTPTSASSTTQNIPSSQKGDLSPQRSTTASPRETTPRTVPKKTASIRRQFASPTSATTQNHNSNCSSPTTAVDEQLTSDRRTPVNSNSSHHQPQHLMQRSSPGNPSLAGSPVHPYSYLYAQPPNGGNSPHTSNAAGSNHTSSTLSPSSVNASAAAAAAAAAAASYIPAVVGSPYYHPYISTLAAMRHPQMWMQHYQSAAAAAANPALMQARHPAILSAAAAAAAGAAARLSPSYHGFQYNGVGNAAALAAAAAAAAVGFGNAVTSPHTSNALLHPSSSIFNPMANSSLHGMQHSAMQTAGLVPASAAAAALSVASPMTDTTDLSKLSKNNFSSISTSMLGVGGSLSTATGSSGNSMYTISNKDEQSSDVPLNLSKH